MAQVPTVTGSIDTADLGPTLMHEHVFVLSPEILQNYGETYWDTEERIADGVAKLNDLASRGITQHRGPDRHRPRPLPALGAAGGRAGRPADRPRQRASTRTTTSPSTSTTGACCSTPIPTRWSRCS